MLIGLEAVWNESWGTRRWVFFLHKILCWLKSLKTYNACMGLHGIEGIEITKSLEPLISLSRGNFRVPSANNKLLLCAVWEQERHSADQSRLP